MGYVQWCALKWIHFMLQISHAASADAKRSVFMKCVRQESCVPTGSIRGSHQTGSWANEGLFLEERDSFMLSSTLHVCNNDHSRGACMQSWLFMFIEENNKVQWEKSKGAGGAACSAAMPPQSRAAFHLLRPPKLHISPPCIRLCYSHPGRHLQSSFSTSLLLLCDFHVLLYGDTASFLPKLFPKQKMRNFPGFFFFCRRAFSSWRRSSRGKSQMMTAIVKGQISPCGFASDCMFISFWSSEDSKPLSRSPHSLNSWSSACHWNRLRADPGDMGKVAVCHPTSDLLETSLAMTSFYKTTVIKA